MKSYAVIILMFLFVSNSIEFKELSKIPFLMEHYSKHKTQYASLSLFTFLKQHYTKETQSDNDENEDNTLPFKSITDNNAGVSYLLFIKDILISSNIFDTPAFYPNNINWKPLDLIFSVFHPPC